jgi:hypothetical protein
MSLGKLNTRLIDDAHRMASICKHLDFAAIVRHDSLAIAQLQQAIQVLGIRKKLVSSPGAKSTTKTLVAVQSGDTGNNDADARKTAAPSNQVAAISAILHEAGFGDRIGCVYNSESKQRVVDFADVNQRKGLPPFLFVIGPDFAPVAGYHGIFVTATEVYAAVFPKNGNGTWQIDARRSYKDLQQMTEWVTLLSAGFSLP